MRCLLQIPKYLLEVIFSVFNMTLIFLAAGEKRKNLIRYVIHDIYRKKQNQFPHIAIPSATTGKMSHEEDLG